MCPFECAALDDRAIGPEAQNTRVTREWGGAKKQPCNTVKGPTVDDHVVKEIESSSRAYVWSLAPDLLQVIRSQQERSQASVDHLGPSGPSIVHCRLSDRLRPNFSSQSTTVGLSALDRRV